MAPESENNMTEGQVYPLLRIVLSKLNGETLEIRETYAPIVFPIDTLNMLKQRGTQLTIIRFRSRLEHRDYLEHLQRQSTQIPGRLRS